MSDSPNSKASFDEVALVQALYSISQESEEPEIIRLSYDALTRTAIGRDYLIAIGEKR